MARKNAQNQTAVSDEEIIAALISSGSLAEAARATGLSPRALYDRMNDRDFKAAYSAAKSDIVRQAVFSISRQLGRAIDTVAAIMEDDENSAGTRLQAARVIIDNAGKFAESLQNEENYIGNLAHKTPFDIDF